MPVLGYPGATRSIPVGFPPRAPAAPASSVTSMDALSGAVIVVTGANSGIGAQIAVAAGAAGAKVVIDHRDSPDQAQEVARRVEEAGGSAVTVSADVTTTQGRAALRDAAVEHFGRLDGWVNNAGVESRTSLLDTDEDAYDSTLDVNLRAAFFCTQVAARRFIEQGGGGVVVNISSIHEDQPMPGNAPYCLAKGGVRMLTRTAGVELAEHGIRVVGVAPGAVDTPINASETSDPETMETLRKAIPLGRMAQPEDIAPAVVFLLSDQAAYVTATTLVLDGGMMQASSGA